MQLEPRITIQLAPQSPALETDIRKKIEKLDNFYSNIVSCEVVIEQEQRKKHHGKIYRPHISIVVPGEKINVNHASNEDVYVAVRDAFRAARRQLQCYARKQRGEKKRHDTMHQGRVARVFIEEGFGFIEKDGEDYYFSTVNLHDTEFDNLRSGMLVEFTSQVSEDGFHAKRVRVTRRAH